MCDQHEHDILLITLRSYSTEFHLYMWAVIALLKSNKFVKAEWYDFKMKYNECSSHIASESTDLLATTLYFGICEAQCGMEENVYTTTDNPYFLQGFFIQSTGVTDFAKCLTLQCCVFRSLVWNPLWIFQRLGDQL